MLDVVFGMDDQIVIRELSGNGLAFFGWLDPDRIPHILLVKARASWKNGRDMRVFRRMISGGYTPTSYYSHWEAEFGEVLKHAHQCSQVARPSLYEVRHG